MMRFTPGYNPRVLAGPWIDDRQDHFESPSTGTGTVTPFRTLGGGDVVNFGAGEIAGTVIGVTTDAGGEWTDYVSRVFHDTGRGVLRWPRVLPLWTQRPAVRMPNAFDVMTLEASMRLFANAGRGVDLSAGLFLGTSNAMAGTGAGGLGFVRSSADGIMYLTGGDDGITWTRLNAGVGGGESYHHYRLDLFAARYDRDAFVRAYVDGVQIAEWSWADDAEKLPAPTYYLNAYFGAGWTGTGRGTTAWRRARFRVWQYDPNDDPPTV